MINYITKHWRGELSLAVSFWINFVLINIAVTAIGKVIEFENPRMTARIFLFWSFFGVVIYLWQIVGLWRACDNSIKKNKEKLVPRAVQFIIFISATLIVVNWFKYWPVYKHGFQIAFLKDKYANYELEIKKDNTIIHLHGMLGLGVSKDVAKLLAQYPDVKGIVLDSNGGRTYEGRKLSRLIKAHHLDTYTLRGCYSSCVTAFIGGEKRYLGTGANLAFHQYGFKDNSLKDLLGTDIEEEQKKDLDIFISQGVSSEFLKIMYNSAQDDLWYPSIDILLNAGVIDGLINPSDIAPTVYQGKLKEEDFEKIISGIPYYKTLEKYEPALYKEMVSKTKLMIDKGADPIELQHFGATYLKIAAMRSMPISSDEALINFGKDLVYGLKKLEKKDPILCLKALYPELYGPILLESYFSEEELNLSIEAFEKIIVDAHEDPTPSSDIQAAEALIEKISPKLEDCIEYIDHQSLQNRDEYKKHCDCMIRFFELTLAESKPEAANYMRYAFSQE